jgi:UDP-N-acetyl-D-glucosamine dehydrogenase
MTESAENRGIRSISPDGRSFRVPSSEDMKSSLTELSRRSGEYGRKGRKTVVVQGLGFVGSAVAAVIAGSRNQNGEPQYFVVGVDLPTEDGYWKVATVAMGEVPVGSPDPELPRLVRESVLVTGNLMATACGDVYSFADVIVMDVPLNVENRFEYASGRISIELETLRSAARAIGETMRSDALVLVETTVPPGICEKVILQELICARKNRGIEEPPLLAHAYERVMPGKEYVSSIRSFWRTYSGIDERSAAAACDFLSSFINVIDYPLTRLESTTGSELAKLLENSYRAVNIAFIHEWTLAAEKLGIDLFSVIDSIRVRKGTHDNMRYPGFGVGGYCLTKDTLLAQWSLDTLFDCGLELGMSLNAVAINNEMPLHTFDLAKELIGTRIEDKTVAILGITYLPGVADIRNTPAEILADALLELGVEVVAHDPCMKTWPGRENVRFSTELRECLESADCIVFAIPHREYLALTPEEILNMSGRKPFIVDAMNILSDLKAEALNSAGCRLLGVGKGHWRKMGLQSCQEEY